MYMWFVFAGNLKLIFAAVGFLLLAYLIVFLLKRKFESVLSWPLLVVAMAWMLFAMWEIFCMEQGYNIRVDALFIYPILILVSLVGFLASVGSIIFGLFKKKHRYDRIFDEMV